MRFESSPSTSTPKAAPGLGDGVLEALRFFILALLFSQSSVQ